MNRSGIMSGTVAALALMLCAPAGAHAATVRMSDTFTGRSAVFTAAPGERNAVEVVQAGGRVVFTDAGAPVTVGDGCSAEGVSVSCPGSVASVDLGDGDDTADVAGADAGVQGGPGNDEILVGRDGGAGGGDGDDRVERQAHVVSGAPPFGGPQPDLDGGPGDDVILGSDAADEALYGGPGDDRIYGRGGVLDSLSGGDGNDLLDGSGPTEVLAFGGEGDDTLIAGDGAGQISVPDGQGIATYVYDDSHLWGGPGDDRLIGAAGPDRLDGGPGADSMRGGAGDDVADYTARTAPLTITADDRPGDGEAGENDDVGSDIEDIIGGAGDDRLVGSPGENVIDGAEGNDDIVGGGGRDFLRGGPGTNVIDAVDGNGEQFERVAFWDPETPPDISWYDDDVDCSSATGTDEVRVDRGLDRLEHCGRADVTYVDPPERTLAVDRAGVVRVSMRCPKTATGPCAGQTRIDDRSGRHALSSAAPFRVPRGRTRVVRVRLAATTRRTFQRHRTLAVSLRTARPGRRMHQPARLRKR
jgi:Ca2+-binding RTX toxin-like protein